MNWWSNNPAALEFEGLKITQDPAAITSPKYAKLLHSVRCNHRSDKLEVGLLGHVGWGGNSGFQTLNLALQWGARPIILAGYDMRVDKGLHWHPDHPRGMNNPTARNVERWRRVIDEAALVLRALGVTVWNASQVSALRSYPKRSLEEILEGVSKDVR